MTHPRDLVPGDEVTAVRATAVRATGNTYKGTVVECSCGDPLCPVLLLVRADGGPMALTGYDGALLPWWASVRIGRPAAGVSVL